MRSNAAALLVALVPLVSCDDPELPEFMPVPEFSLTDQHGQPFGTQQLRGKVWVANFIFTTCPTVCPMLTTQMGNLARRVEHNDVRYVSISVDPDNDTPDALSTYAQQHDAHWTFLTGETAAVRRTITEGLRMTMGERGPDGDILHGTHFVLVDRNSRIRGYYRKDSEGQQNLERDLHRLLQ